MLTVVLILSAAPRLAGFRSLDQASYFELLQVDARHYHEQATALLEGRSISPGRPFYQDPLYPYFLAGIYRLSGVNPLRVVAVQMVMGLVTVASVTLLGAAVGGPWLGLVAGVGCGFYRPLLFYESVLLKTSLSTMLVTLALLLLVRGRRPASQLAAGMATGCAILTQGQVWVLVPVFAFAAWRRRGVHAVAVVLGTILAIAPVTLSNHARSGRWVMATSQSGQNLYTGNGPHVRGGRYRAPDFVRPNPRFEEDDFRAEAQRRSGRQLDASEVSSFWSRAALAWMWSEPKRAAGNFLRKLAEVVNAYEVPDNLNLAFERTRRPLLDAPLVGYGMVAPLALSFAILTLARREAMAWMAAAALAYHAIIALFFVFSRYRVPIAPLLFVLAAAGLWRWGEVIRTRDRRQGALYSVLLAATTLCVHIPTEPVGLARARINLGNAHAEQAGHLFASGDVAAARRHLATAAEALSVAAAEEPFMAEPLFLRAIVEATSGDLNAATATLQLALSREPDHVQSLVLLSQVLEKLGRREEAEQRWRQAQEIDVEAAADTLRFMRERR